MSATGHPKGETRSAPREGAPVSAGRMQDQSLAQPQGYRHDHAHEHSHDHAHDHSHGNAHGHGHLHGQDHAHAHAGHDHAPHTPRIGHASHAHTPAPLASARPADLDGGAPSLLMRSAGGRLAGALLLICALWLAVGWALMERAP